MPAMASRARAKDCLVRPIPFITSTSFIRSTGAKKCRPINLSGRLVLPARMEIGIVEVLLANGIGANDGCSGCHLILNFLNLGDCFKDQIHTGDVRIGRGGFKTRKHLFRSLSGHSISFDAPMMRLEMDSKPAFERP